MMQLKFSRAASIIFGVSILLLSAGCKNPLGGEASSSEISQSYHPGSAPSPFTLNIPYAAGSESSYSVSDASSVEFVGGVARLKASDQTDNTTNIFSASTNVGVQWDGTANALRLNTATNNSELDASWTPQWGNLKAYWKFNETSGTLAADSSGQGNTGTLMGGVTLNSAGQIGSSFGLNGSSGYVKVTWPFTNDITSAVQSGSVTFCTWVKPSSVTAEQGLIGVGDSTSHGLNLMVASGEVYFWYSGGTLIKGGSLQAGAWSQVCGVAASLSNISVYINGSLVKTGSTALGSFTLTPVSSRLVIGNEGQLAASRYLGGVLDETAIWSSPLSANEIQLLYSRQSAKYAGQVTSRVMDAKSAGATSTWWTTLSAKTNLPFYKELSPSPGETTANYVSTVGGLETGIVALWHFNEAIGTTGASSVIDSSGQGHHGTPTGMTFGSPGAFGALAQVATGTDKIVFNNIAELSNVQKFTISTWQYFPAFVDFADLIAQGIDGNNRVGIQLNGNYGGNPCGTNNRDIYVTVGNGSDSIACSSNAPLVTSHWTHILVVYDGTQATNATRLKVYLDGVQLTSISYVGTAIPATTASTTANFTVGPVFNTPGFVHGVDETAIWNRTLSSAEILEVYRRGANRLKYQVRTCATSDCSDQDALTATGLGWKGPGGSQLTYFSELYNTTANALGGAISMASPVMTFANFVSSGLSITPSRWLQYRAIFESDDAGTLCTYGGSATACSPELSSIAIGPSHYSTASPSIVSSAAIGTPYTSFDIAGFTETLGTSCATGTRYALSPNGVIFYYWNGTSWSVSSDVTTSNDAATVTANISNFASSIAGTGVLQVKTFLKSTGTVGCEIDNLSFKGLQ